MLLEQKSSTSNSPLHKNKLIRLIYKTCLLGGVFLFFIQLVWRITNPSLPSEKEPLFFYSNQTSNDLKILFHKAIAETKNSLFLQIYGCTDPHILQELKKTSDRNVDISLFYDPSGSGPLNKKLPFATPLQSQGLMHKKILISDDERVFIGSANLTPTSLRMHDNLVVGLYHKELAFFIKNSIENHFLFSIGNQPAEFWHLPDFQNGCLERMIQRIDEASKSIHIALFTFTHPKLIQALIRAKKRKVKIHLTIDHSSSQGASRKAIEELCKNGISPLKSEGGKLLHHKWALIDQKTLFLGSANWTRLAFQKNEDCLFILHNLTEKQTNYFLKLWAEIKRNSLQ